MKNEREHMKWQWHSPAYTGEMKGKQIWSAIVPMYFMDEHKKSTYPETWRSLRTSEVDYDGLFNPLSKEFEETFHHNSPVRHFYHHYAKEFSSCVQIEIREEL